MVRVGWQVGIVAVVAVVVVVAVVEATHLSES